MSIQICCVSGDFQTCGYPVVGPVGFEPTTSGPDVLGVTSAPGSPSITGLWYPLGGVNPLDQARRRPPSLGLNPQVFYLSVGQKIVALSSGLRDKAMRADRRVPDSWKRPLQQRQLGVLLSNGIFQNQ